MKRRTIFSIEDSLRLKVIGEQPGGVIPFKHWFEEAVDVLVFLNFRLLCQHIFAQRGYYLFSNFRYWHTPDVGGVLDDGCLVVFENKKVRPSKRDFIKFYDDLRTRKTWCWDGPELRNLYRHNFCDSEDDFEMRVCRAFCGFFLNVRAATTKDSRNLVVETAQKLSTTQNRVQCLFKEAMRGIWPIQPEIHRELQRHGIDYSPGKRINSAIRAALFVPNTKPEHINYRLNYPEIQKRINVKFTLAEYELMSNPQASRPEYMSITVWDDYEL